MEQYQENSADEWNDVYDQVLRELSKKENKPDIIKERECKLAQSRTAAQSNVTTYKKHNMYDELDLFVGKYTAMEEVHHIVPISKGRTREDYRFLSQHPMNLMSLSEENHHNIHYNNEAFTTEQLRWVKYKYDLVMDDWSLYKEGKLPNDYFVVK